MKGVITMMHYVANLCPFCENYAYCEGECLIHGKVGKTDDNGDPMYIIECDDFKEKN